MNMTQTEYTKYLRIAQGDTKSTRIPIEVLVKVFNESKTLRDSLDKPTRLALEYISEHGYYPKIGAGYAFDPIDRWVYSASGTGRGRPLQEHLDILALESKRRGLTGGTDKA